MKKPRCLFIEPQDVWMFRDGRPFDAGSAHRASSMFPPFPTVLQGAIRSNQVVLEGVELGTGRRADGKTIRDIVGDPLTFDGALNLNGLQMRGPFVARRISPGRVERLFPLPADAYYQHSGGIAPSMPQKLSDAQVSGKPAVLLVPGEDAAKPDGFQWLTATDLDKYFRGETVQGVDESELLQRENRFGVGRNSEWVVKEGMLYEAEFLRLAKDVGFVLEMSGYDHPGWAAGLLQFGGEARAAVYSTVSVDEWPDAPIPLPGQFRIYFATPTYFKNGAEPEDWSTFFKGDARLVARALRGYETVGGFDWARNADSQEAHRASRRYVPAGSVYYFENAGGAELNASALTEFGAELGFGQFILFASKEW